MNDTTRAAFVPRPYSMRKIAPSIPSGTAITAVSRPSVRVP